MILINGYSFLGGIIFELNFNSFSHKCISSFFSTEYFSNNNIINYLLFCIA